MAEVQGTEEQASSTMLTTARKLYLTLAFLCITASALLFVIVIVITQTSPNTKDSSAVKIVLAMGLSLLFIGCGVLHAYRKK